VHAPAVEPCGGQDGRQTPTEYASALAGSRTPANSPATSLQRTRFRVQRRGSSRAIAAHFTKCPIPFPHAGPTYGSTTPTGGFVPPSSRVAVDWLSFILQPEGAEVRNPDGGVRPKVAAKHLLLAGQNPTLPGTLAMHIRFEVDRYAAMSRTATPWQGRPPAAAGSAVHVLVRCPKRPLSGNVAIYLSGRSSWPRTKERGRVRNAASGPPTPSLQQIPPRSLVCCSGRNSGTHLAADRPPRFTAPRRPEVPTTGEAPNRDRSRRLAQTTGAPLRAVTTG